MDFENFCKNHKQENCINCASQQEYEECEKLVNKYKNKSNTELMQELMSIAKTEKAKGNLNKTKLNEIYETLSSVLSEKEKENLKNLINMIS
ncbi:MAG: DUF1722 domain-containing protein [Christensenellales bacterium]